MATSVKSKKKTNGKSKIKQEKLVTEKDSLTEDMVGMEKLKSPSPDLKKGHTLFAAIDFGTTYSGYSFAFTSKPGEVRVNKNWGSSLGFQVSFYASIMYFIQVVAEILKKQ